MSKALIFLILILNWGCNRGIFLYERTSDTNMNLAEQKIFGINNNNISQESYFIEKADLSIKNNNSITRFIFTVKYEKPDKFLFSIRSPIGTEGARIFLTDDTVLINDRIQRRLLYGKPERIEKATGLPSYMINMVFGDLIIKGDSGKTRTEQTNDQIILWQEYNGKTLKSVLDKRISKVRDVVLMNGSPIKAISLEYSKFSKTDKHYPGVIIIKDYNRNIEATIRLRKIQIPWEGTIEFIPGSDYKKEEIK